MHCFPFSFRPSREASDASDGHKGKAKHSDCKGLNAAFLLSERKGKKRRRFVLLQPTAELDRSGDQVYTGVMAMVKQVVQMKNDVNTMPASEYPICVKVGTA